MGGIRPFPTRDRRSEVQLQIRRPSQSLDHVARCRINQCTLECTTGACRITGPQRALTLGNQLSNRREHSPMIPRITLPTIRRGAAAGVPRSVAVRATSNAPTVALTAPSTRHLTHPREHRVSKFARDTARHDRSSPILQVPGRRTPAFLPWACDQRGQECWFRTMGRPAPGASRARIRRWRARLGRQHQPVPGRLGQAEPIAFGYDYTDHEGHNAISDTIKWIERNAATTTSTTSSTPTTASRLHGTPILCGHPPLHVTAVPGNDVRYRGTPPVATVR
jgi:hypothetical protein